MFEWSDVSAHMTCFSELALEKCIKIQLSFVCIVQSVDHHLLVEMSLFFGMID
jgi:hypothetical protein